MRDFAENACRGADSIPEVRARLPSLLFFVFRLVLLSPRLHFQVQLCAQPSPIVSNCLRSVLLTKSLFVAARTLEVVATNKDVREKVGRFSQKNVRLFVYRMFYSLHVPLFAEHQLQVANRAHGPKQTLSPSSLNLQVAQGEIAVAPPPSPPRPRFTTNNFTPITPPPAPPAHTEENTEDPLKKVLGDGPGTCMVCLEDCEDVVGSAWLHPQPSAAAENEKEESNKESDQCGVSACAACLKTYFTVCSVARL